MFDMSNEDRGKADAGMDTNDEDGEVTDLVQRLTDMRACPPALDWARTRPAKASLKSAWDECPDGSWLLWVAATLGVDHKRVVMAACACARTALRHVPRGEKRPLAAIRTAEAWCRDEATLDEVRVAADAAYAAAADAADADSYAASSASDAASSAADVANAADAVACAASCAASSASYAAEAATYAAAAGAGARRSLARSAAIVRRKILWRVVRATLTRSTNSNRTETSGKWFP